MDSENIFGSLDVNNLSKVDFSSDDSIVDPNFDISGCAVSSSDSENDTMNSENTTKEIVANKVQSSTRKALRNRGESYISTAGKHVPARIVRPLESCRKKCAQRITYEEQQLLHKQYWGLGSYNLRKAHASGLIEVEETYTVKRFKHETNPRNRAHTYYYFLEIRGNRVSVCQKCFRFTLSETEQFIKTIAKEKLEGIGVKVDMRGKHKGPKKLSVEKEKEVLDFIKSFPSYESHYTRRDTSQRYLSSDLSVAEMHRLYGEKYEQSISLSKFAQLFGTLNLKFKKPKVDTCHKCDLLQSKMQAANNEEIESLKLEKTEHLNLAQEAYDSKKTDKDIAINNNDFKVFFFDLQQCLPTPLLRTSLSFYKRPLWTYNLTLHDCTTNQPMCYMWHEAIAKRGGNEISSCIFAHLLELNTNIKNVVFYSDCCPGQKKNSFIATMFAIFLQLDNDVSIIDHKFMVPGHTHMECDSDHAAIEKKKKKTTIKIHHPRDWYQFIRTVGIKNKFIVNEMEQSNMLDFAYASKNLFTWRNISKRRINCVKMKDLKKCYDSPIKISAKKKNDLLEMLPLVDEIYKDFYINLRSEDMLDFHPDLTSYDESEE